MNIPALSDRTLRRDIAASPYSIGSEIQFFMIPMK